MDGPDADVPRTGADASARAGACTGTREACRAEAGREEEGSEEAGQEEGRQEAGQEEGSEEEGRKKAGEEEGGEEEGREAASQEESGPEGEEDRPEESRQEEREVSPAQRPGPPGRFSTRPSRPAPMRILLAAAAMAAAACSTSPAPSAPAPAPAELTAEFQQQFQRSANDWNRGDLDAFMSDYARDSLTSFVASGHLRFGYDRIREGYASQFAPGARRDSLRFEEFHVRVLSPTLALVNARYILHRDGATSSSGPFTLVMERQADGWKILHDHTHSDPR